MVVNEKRLLETIKSQIIHILNMGDINEIKKIIIQSLIELDKLVKRNNLEGYTVYIANAIQEYQNFTGEIDDFKFQIRQYLLPNIDKLIKYFS